MNNGLLRGSGALSATNRTSPSSDDCLASIESMIRSVYTDWLLQLTIHMASLCRECLIYYVPASEEDELQNSAQDHYDLVADLVAVTVSSMGSSLETEVFMNPITAQHSTAQESTREGVKKMK